jgi:hypothetical protein
MISFVKKATNFISLLILKSKVPSIMLLTNMPGTNRLVTNRLVTILGANILDTNIRLTNLIWQPR